MPLQSSSQIALEIISGVSPASLETLKKLREQIEKADVDAKTLSKTLATLSKSLTVGGKFRLFSPEQFTQFNKLVNAVQTRATQLDSQLTEISSKTQVVNARKAEQDYFKLKQIQENYLKFNQQFQDNIVKQSEKADLAQVKLTQNRVDQKIKSEQNYQGLLSRLREQEVNFEKSYTALTQQGLAQESAFREKTFITRQQREQNYQNLVSSLRKKELSSQKLHAQAILQNQKFDENYAKLQLRAIKENAQFNQQAQQQIINTEKQKQSLITKNLNLQKKYITDAQAAQKFARITQLVKGVEPTSPLAIHQLERLQRITNAVNQSIVAQGVALGPLGHAWEKFRLIFARVFDALAAFVIIDWSRRIFVGFFKSLIQSNQLLEVLRARLGSLIPVSSEVERIWKVLQRITITTPFRVDEIVEASVLVKAFGVDIEKNMMAIADWATAIGRDVKDVAIGFGKIVAFSPRTALLLSTRGFSLAAFESYVARYGDRTTALRRLIEDTFGGTAKRVALTFQGIMANTNDLWIFISQTLGQPLFEALKRDLRFIYNLFTDINNANKEWLTTLGQFINIVTYSAIFGGLSLGLAGIAGQFVKFIYNLKLAGNAFKVFMGTLKITLPLVIFSTFIFKVFELRDAFKQLEIAQSDYMNALNEQDISKQIDALERQTQTIKESLVWYNELIIILGDLIRLNIEYNDSTSAESIIRFKTIDYLRQELDARQKSLEIKQKEKAEELRGLAIKNAQRDAIRDYNTAQKVAEAGLSKAHSERAKELREEIELDKKVLVVLEENIKRHGIKSDQAAENLKNQIAIKTALMDYYGGISKVIPAEEKRTKLLENLNKSLMANIDVTGNVAQTVSQMIQAHQELVDDYIGTLEKGKESVDEFGLKVKNLTADFIQLLEEFKQLSEGETAREAKIKGLESKLEAVGITDFEQHFENLQLWLNEINTQTEKKNKLSKEELKNLELITKKWILQLSFGKDILTLIKLRITDTERLAELDQNILEKNIDLRNSVDDLIRTLFQFKIESGLIKDKYSEMNKLFNDNVKSFLNIGLEIVHARQELEKLTGIAKQNKEIDILKLRQDQINKLRDIYNLLNYIYSLPSPTFTDAITKQIIKLRDEWSKFNDEIAETITQAGRKLIFDVAFEFITGEKRAELDRQIEDLQFDLQKVRAEKLGIQIIENKELEILAKINELEEQRGNILLNMVSEVINKIRDKLLDLASAEIMKKIFQFSVDESQTTIAKLVKQYEDLLLIMDKAIPKEAAIEMFGALELAKQAGKDLVSLSGEDLLIGLQRLAIERQIAEYKKTRPGRTENGGGFDPLDLLKNIPSPSGGAILDSPIGTETGGFFTKTAIREIPRETTTIEKPIISNQTTNKIVNMNFSGDIYGYDEFKRKVDKANREIKRNIV